MMLKNTLYLDVFDEYIHLLGDILVQFLLGRLYLLGIASCEEQCVVALHCCFTSTVNI